MFKNHPGVSPPKKMFFSEYHRGLAQSTTVFPTSRLPDFRSSKFTAHQNIFVQLRKLRSFTKTS
jgi:hypothetical protein